MSIGETNEELIEEFRNTIELLPARAAEWREASRDLDVVAISVLDVPPVKAQFDRRYEMTKRLFDVAVAGVILIAVSPILVTAILAVRLTSQGPAVFRQQRVGRHGNLFTILKLRSMYIDADDSRQREFNKAELRGELDNVEEFTLDNDNRITSVGHFIRKFSIDELPQLWNVVRGDMSLVGPRPSCDWEVELYEPRFRRRLDVRPGITGLWQVTGRRTIDMRGMLELDVQYVDHPSFRNDLTLLVRTVPAVLKGTGAS